MFRDTWRRFARPRMGFLASLALLALWLMPMTLASSAPFTHPISPAQAHARQNKLRLDRELAHARLAIGVPITLLTPITSQELAVAAIATHPNVDQDQVASDYATLDSQLLTLEHTSAQTLHDEAAGDLQLLMTQLDDRRSQGFADIDVYQARLDTALSAFAAARTTADFARVDGYVTQNLVALRALWPSYQRLQSFRRLLRTFALAGVPSAIGQQDYQQDIAALDAALTPAGYAALSQQVDAQTRQTVAAEADALMINGAAPLAQLQAGVTLLQQQGDAADASALQQAQRQAARAQAALRQPATLTAVGASLVQQIERLELPLQRAAAQGDLQAFTTLLGQAQGETLLDPFTGRRYPAAYEYADNDVGLGMLQRKVASAHTVEAYQSANDDIQRLTTNLHALLNDLHDATSHSAAHQTDLSLLAYYGLLQGKVIVVSLTEQVARFYDQGRLVSWSYVTTGRIELPSPPGLHYAMTKNAPVLFTSPEARNSPLWFAPTPVNYAIAYYPGGDFLHDAWWRTQFGPGTQLPHYDPAAFNGGSHGCINFPQQQMQWVYDWTQIGTPVLVY